MYTVNIDLAYYRSSVDYRLLDLNSCYVVDYRSFVDYSLWDLNSCYVVLNGAVLYAVESETVISILLHNT